MMKKIIFFFAISAFISCGPPKEIHVNPVVVFELNDTMHYHIQAKLIDIQGCYQINKKHAISIQPFLAGLGLGYFYTMRDAGKRNMLLLSANAGFLANEEGGSMGSPYRGYKKFWDNKTKYQFISGTISYGFDDEHYGIKLGARYSLYNYLLFYRKLYHEDYISFSTSVPIYKDITTAKNLYGQCLSPYVHIFVRYDHICLFGQASYNFFNMRHVYYHEVIPRGGPKDPDTGFKTRQATYNKTNINIGVSFDF